MKADIIDRGRGPEIAGTRITVFDVLDYLDARWEDRGIAAALGLLTDEVEAARLYIEQHADEVAAEYRKIKERISRGNPPEIQAKLAAARSKLRALRDQISPARRGDGDAEHHG
jgi:uncharacterized protein (DUF433 family)